MNILYVEVVLLLLFFISFVSWLTFIVLNKITKKDFDDFIWFSFGAIWVFGIIINSLAHLTYYK